MELSIFPRKKAGKSAIRKLRLQGAIPAIVYAKGKANEEISVNAHDFGKLLNRVQRGRLSTTLFTLKEDKKSYTVLIKDIQYDVTSYEVLHIDFIQLSEKEKVTVSIPVECVGEEARVGVKLGGLLRQPLRTLKVSCLPKDIPPAFQIDVSGLELGRAKRLKDMVFPAGVKPLAQMQEVVVLVAKR